MDVYLCFSSCMYRKKCNLLNAMDTENLGAWMVSKADIIQSIKGMERKIARRRIDNSFRECKG